MARLNWRDDAACIGMFTMFDYDREYFESQNETIAHERGRALPIMKGTVPYQEKVAKMAINICNSCPVRTECLDDALQHGDEYTIRGGLLPKQRHILMSKMGIKTYSQRRMEIDR